MVSTITNSGKVEFMKQLIKGKKRKMFLISDNLRVYHSKILKDWTEGNKDKIVLFYLPSYSPEKNPDEYLNCDLKYNLSITPAPKNAEQLRNNIENHMEMLQGDQEHVRKYFRHKDIRYAS